MATLTAPVALSPQQVNSYPGPSRPDLGIDGNDVPATTAAQKNEALLQLARDRFRISQESSDRQRKEMMEDLDFYCPRDADGQWDALSLASRRQQNRPVLTINRIPSFVLHVANNMRQSRPGIKVIPTGEDGADQEDAEVRQGLIRYIETNSRADIPYDSSFENMCIMGLGWMRVVDDWASPTSFDKDLFIRWVPNTFSVYWDPFCQQPDWSDMKYAFVTEDMSVREFKAKYGDKYDAVDVNLFKGIGDQSADWWVGQKIRVAEYFYIDYEDDISCEMSDKAERLYSELRGGDDGDKYSLVNDGDGERVLHFNGEPIGRTRPCRIPSVKWALITGLDIIKTRNWKGKHIPLIPVIGNQIRKNAENIMVGMVRYAKEPQRMYNYAYTSFVETVALAPRSPFIAELDQIPAGLEGEWQDANKQLTALLRYKSVNAPNGTPLPPPQRQQAEPPIAAFVQLLKLCDDMMKSVFSIYDASLGQRGAQESGMAINARKIESDTGTYNWGDNFIRSLRYLGIVLNDLLEHYYNTPGRILQITREDDSMRKITLNQPFEEDGEMKHFDLSKGGKCGIVVSTEPSFQTQRQEKASSMMSLVKGYPALMQLAGDIIIKELDFPGKDAIAERLEKALPPGLKPPDKDAPPIPPQVQATLDQAMQQIKMLTSALHEAMDKKDLERMKQEYDTLRTQMTQEVALAVASMKTGSQEATFLNQKIFEELERMRGYLEGTLTKPQASGQPQQAQPAQPSSAVPQTVGGAPSVGGV